MERLKISEFRCTLSARGSITSAKISGEKGQSGGSVANYQKDNVTTAEGLEYNAIRSKPR